MQYNNMQINIVIIFVVSYFVLRVFFTKRTIVTSTHEGILGVELI